MQQFILIYRLKDFRKLFCKKNHENQFQRFFTILFCSLFFIVPRFPYNIMESGDCFCQSFCVCCVNRLFVYIFIYFIYLFIYSAICWCYIYFSRPKKDLRPCTAGYLGSCQGLIHLVRTSNFSKNQHFLPPDTKLTFLTP